MSMMSVLDKSLTIIYPDRNVREADELRQRITRAYHETKVTEETGVCTHYTTICLSGSRPPSYPHP